MSSPSYDGQANELNMKECLKKQQKKESDYRKLNEIKFSITSCFLNLVVELVVDTIENKINSRNQPHYHGGIWKYLFVIFACKAFIYKTH